MLVSLFIKRISCHLFMHDMLVSVLSFSSSTPLELIFSKLNALEKQVRDLQAAANLPEGPLSQQVLITEMKTFSVEALAHLSFSPS